MDDAEEGSEDVIIWYGGEYAGQPKPGEWWRGTPYWKFLSSLEQIAFGFERMLHLPASFLYDLEQERELDETVESSNWMQTVKVGGLGQFGDKWCFKKDMQMARPLLLSRFIE